MYNYPRKRPALDKLLAEGQDLRDKIDELYPKIAEILEIDSVAELGFDADDMLLDYSAQDLIEMAEEMEVD